MAISLSMPRDIHSLMPELLGLGWQKVAYSPAEDLAWAWGLEFEVGALIVMRGMEVNEFWVVGGEELCYKLQLSGGTPSPFAAWALLEAGGEPIERTSTTSPWS